MCKFFANFFSFIFNFSLEVVLLRQRYKLSCDYASFLQLYFKLFLRSLVWVALVKLRITSFA